MAAQVRQTWTLILVCIAVMRRGVKAQGLSGYPRDVLIKKKLLSLELNTEESPDEDMELATKNPQKRTTEGLTEKSKEYKLLDAITRNLLEIELMPLDDEEPILIEEKTKHKEKEVSLKKTDRRESGENNKHGTPSTKRPTREDAKNKAQTNFEETKLDTIKQRRKPSQKQKEPQLPRNTKVDTRQTTNIKNRNDCARKRKCKRNKGPAKEIPLIVTLKSPKGLIT
mgnify:CR=1 FL=1